MSGPVGHVSQVEACVGAELAKQAFGQDFGYAVTWQPAQTPTGVMCAWSLLFTLRSPLLGQPLLGFVAQLVVQSVPPDEVLAGQVTQACEALRALSEAAKHPPKPVPAGLVAANGRRG